MQNKFVPTLNLAPPHEDALESGGKAIYILNLGTRLQ
jgi:hypothetical protein